jgi:hypothetical protein
VPVMTKTTETTGPDMTKSAVRDHDRDKPCDGDEPDRVLYAIRGGARTAAQGRMTMTGRRRELQEKRVKRRQEGSQ